MTYTTVKNQCKFLIELAEKAVLRKEWKTFYVTWPSIILMKQIVDDYVPATTLMISAYTGIG